MGTLINGMALHGGLIPFGATFFVFADYERPALRLSAMQKLRVLHIFTHDSFFVGEDGPTHQPIEHLASLRAIPNLLVIRPADANETSVAIKIALKERKRPTALVLTRQKLPVLDRTMYPSAELLGKGAYIIYGDENEKPDVIIIATGSEVHLALETAKSFSEIKVRVVNMPSAELFEMQNEEYKNRILPPQISARLTIEAGSTFGWHKYAGSRGIVYGIDHYGNSAPGGVLQEAYGFTVKNMVKIIKEKILVLRKMELGSSRSSNNKLFGFLSSALLQLICQTPKFPGNYGFSITPINISIIIVF
uniref:transketolase n=1 Tax=uncultured organism TaxID=155900 RepID=E3T316_9ZZZZ|nr:transketolase [uncultured organism]